MTQISPSRGDPNTHTIWGPTGSKIREEICSFTFIEELVKCSNKSTNNNVLCLGLIVKVVNVLGHLRAAATVLRKCLVILKLD